MSQLIVRETPIQQCFIVEFPKHDDIRGSFQRKYCESSFRSVGLNGEWRQSNVSLNHKKATFRGFHYQENPFEEIKLVTCVKGRIQDVIIDIRKDSPTYKKTFSLELNENDNISLYIAQGVAHGYLTLEDDTVVLYHVSAEYSKEKTRGISWKDSSISIDWIIMPEIISDADKNWPEL
jgi:dTDP-4-dehydrorhamnose 3,5-epimerase